MANPVGSFIWYELMTPDADAIAPFYRAVVGWTIGAGNPAQAGGPDYRMIARTDGKSAGGVLRLNDDMLRHGAQPLWIGYLYTPGVDATVKAIVADGGKVQMGATNLPVGRIAMVSDPQGVPFYVMTPIPPPGQPDATSDLFDRHARERVNWNELSSPDLEASKAFYSRHFGFAFHEKMDMGPLGDYCFIDLAGQQIGAITGQADKSQRPAWLFYFGVASIAAAKRAIEAHGGRVLVGPHQVPTGEWIVMAVDPAGAAFGLTGPLGE